MECIYTLGTSSASHTYGNVAAHVKELLVHSFPKDFFSYAFVDSKIAWKNVSEVLGNGDAEFKKRHYPFLIVTPQYDVDDDDRFLADTPLTTNFDNAIAGLTRNTLFPIVKDRQHQIELAYRLNRGKITFEIELRLRSLQQAIDVKNDIKNRFVWKRSYTVPVALESMIPKSMIEYIGKMAGIDITDESSNQVPLIMQYLNGHSRHPITYKVRNDTSVDEFFLYYKTNVLLTFTNLQKGTPSKKNAVDEYYPLTFTIDAEFNMPGLYALIGTHEKKFHGWRFDAIVQSTDALDIIPMYTFTNLYDQYAQDTLDGFSFYSCTTCQTEDENRGGDEVIDMKDLIPPTHMRVIESLTRDNVPPETLFRFRMLLNDHEIPCDCTPDQLPDGLWKVDWLRHRIVIHKSDPLVTYRILIYANMVVLNDRYAQMQDKTKQDIPGLG